MPSGYTLKRRIGSFRTNSSAQIIDFVQDGDEFSWVAPFAADISATNPGASAVTRTLTVPTGLGSRPSSKRRSSTATPGAASLSSI
jgi:hypothetical protein